MLVKFINLSHDQQERLNDQARKEMLEKRSKLQQLGHNPENIFYTKLSYINNFKLSDNRYYNTCECGKVLELDSTVIYDKVSDCQQREVLYKCKCNQYNKIYS